MPQWPLVIQSNLTHHHIRDTVGYTSLEVTEDQNYIYHGSHLVYFLFTFKYDLVVIFLIIIRANIYLSFSVTSIYASPFCPLTLGGWGEGGSRHG